MISVYRTHHCSELRLQDINTQIQLSGWVHVKRDHGKLLFIDLRDNFGITQLVIHDDKNFFPTLSKITNESVISIKGTVIPRNKENINKDIPTGEIEVNVDSCNIESKSSYLPFAVNNEDNINDEINCNTDFYNRNKILKKLH